MRVIQNLNELREPVGASVLTIGNFDGVHLAHQALLRKVVQTAEACGGLPAAITFDPHPTKILAPERAANGVFRHGVSSVLAAGRKYAAAAGRSANGRDAAIRISWFVV